MFDVRTRVTTCDEVEVGRPLRPNKTMTFVGILLENFLHPRNIVLATYRSLVKKKRSCTCPKPRRPNLELVAHLEIARPVMMGPPLTVELLTVGISSYPADAAGAR